MRRTNAVIEAIKISPCSADELPYLPKIGQMGKEDMKLFRKIKVVGRSSKTKGPQRGTFKTVYFLDGNLDQAVSKFVDINFDLLSKIDFTKNNHLYSGLPKNMAKKIIAEFKSETFKVLNQRIYKV